ncbi:LysR family transcriptional regulator [Microbulbifer thermotolerans]|uniref:LysR family transcriptional regulator n=1 Tax=Microbulbifer thermotolerans TaxID=252514 RepID=UPI00224B7EF7|nr:LysR family transcriptional regulator [Microbulbifer thermotolerans]MCX2780449.1 LysR family transcriptional regulator [Microbulbifer thermotolerans]MCX2805985.1 LysR family transcriptional regulator [Microbulbifer thermotolerans]MCX2842457.1 LysR family transcriptional regulator [Microbulbifer thermotolerans]
MNNISWRWVRAFLLVAEYGSFTAASNASGHSKANISQQVTALEQALGVQLLHRTTRNLRLTSVGRGYFERSQLAFRQLDSAAEWAMQSTQELKGVIRMNSVGGLIGEELIAPLVFRFQQANPEVDVELDFSSTRVDLLNSPYDLVVRMGELTDSTLVARSLHRITTRYVASPEFLAHHGPIHAPADLRELPLIYGSVDHWLLERGDEQQLIPAKNGFRIVSGRAMRQAALSGLGVTRLTDTYVQADIARGDLVEVLPEWSETTQLSLVCPPHRHQLKRVRGLMDWLKEHFAEVYEKALREVQPLRRMV